MTPTRPVLRWHGGKWMLAPWIIEHFPPHRVYVEPFGGAGSVLMRKQRSYAEVWNDLDGNVVNLFQVLHYVDPPYVFETRTDLSKDYAHELSDDDHRELLQFLRGLQGSVILSGYPSDIYDQALSDWRRVERRALADGASERTEVLWINPNCQARIEAEQPALLLGGAA